MSTSSSVSTFLLYFDPRLDIQFDIRPFFGKSQCTADMNDRKADLRGGKLSIRVEEFWRCAGAPLLLRRTLREINEDQSQVQSGRQAMMRELYLDSGSNGLC